MRGHIRKRSNDSYSIVLSLGNDPATGKRIRQWVTVKGSKRDAEKRLAELLHQHDTGSYVKPAKTTVGEYLDRWLNDYASPNLSPRGFERYAGIVKKYLIPSLGNIPLTQLRTDHLQNRYTEWLNNGLNPRTIQYHHAIIHKALQTALKWGLVARNVADGAEVPRPSDNEMQTYNESEVNEFIEAARDSQYYALFYTALYTGARRSELLALRWQDVDFIYSQVHINRSLHHLKDGSYVFTKPKSTRSRRSIALSPSASLVLQDHFEKQRMERAYLGKTLSDNDLVFSNAEGQPFRPNTITRAWQSIAARAGIKVIRFHDARHTHASLMLKKGIHPKIVQERLGHASIQMTLDTYSHVAPGLQEAAAKSFDEILRGSKRVAKSLEVALGEDILASKKAEKIEW